MSSEFPWGAVIVRLAGIVIFGFVVFWIRAILRGVAIKDLGFFGLPMMGIVVLIIVAGIVARVLG